MWDVKLFFQVHSGVGQASFTLTMWDVKYTLLYNIV